jgi:hypothetical protein
MKEIKDALDSAGETFPAGYGILQLLIVFLIAGSLLKGGRPYDIISISACAEAIES